MTQTADNIGYLLLTALERHHANPRVRVLLPSDLYHAGRISSVIRRGAELTPQDAREAYRILSRADLEAVGLAIPPWMEPPASGTVTADAPVPQPNPQSPVLRMRRDEASNWYGIAVTNSFPYKDTLKALGGVPHKSNGAFEWRFPATPGMCAALLDALAGSVPRASPRVVEMAESFRAQADYRVTLDESAPLPVFDTTALIKPGFDLWDHQRRMVDYCSKVPASLFAVTMGGGKTLATIAMANKTEAKRIVITCPNKVRGVWQREVRKFSAQGWHIVSGFRESKRARSGRVSLSVGDRLRQAEECLFDCACRAPHHAVVVNYEAFAHEPWASWRSPVMLDLLVADEIHRIKAHNGKISRALAEWVGFTQRRVGLTGTPMPQTPLDVFGTFRLLDPGIFGTKWTTFRQRYAVENPHVQGHVVGYQNIEELREKFFSITYLPEVDLKLPTITDITREFDLEPKARKAYDSLDAAMWADITGFVNSPDPETLQRLNAELTESIRDFAHDSGESVDDFMTGLRAEVGDVMDQSDETHTVTPANVMVRLLRLQQFTGGTVIDDDKNRIRVSHGKAELLDEVLDDVGCVAGGEVGPEPVVVFCRFRSDLDAVKEIAGKRGLRYAEVSGRQHDGLTEDSEMNPDCDIVGVQIQSGGTGVDLTRSHIMIWYSMGYSLSDYDQARKRTHRPGQTKPVLSIHLLATDTADMDVYEALADRRTVIAGVLDRHGVDPASLGVQDIRLSPEEIEMMDGKGAVQLPFDQLINSGKAFLGEPGVRRNS